MSPAGARPSGSWTNPWDEVSRSLSRLAVSWPPNGVGTDHAWTFAEGASAAWKPEAESVAHDAVTRYAERIRVEQVAQPSRFRQGLGETGDALFQVKRR